MTRALEASVLIVGAGPVGSKTARPQWRPAVRRRPSTTTKRNIEAPPHRESAPQRLHCVAGIRTLMCREKICLFGHSAMFGFTWTGHRPNRPRKIIFSARLDCSLRARNVVQRRRAAAKLQHIGVRTSHGNIGFELSMCRKIHLLRLRPVLAAPAAFTNRRACIEGACSSFTPMRTGRRCLPRSNQVRSRHPD
jgi:hypothetical protein